MTNTRKDPYKLSKLRTIVQIVFLALFIFLGIKAITGRVIGSPVPTVIFNILLAASTIIFGRIWCGWVCPMGTLLYWTRKKNPKILYPSIKTQKVKIVIFLVLLIPTIFGWVQPINEIISQNPVFWIFIVGGFGLVAISLNLIVEMLWCRYLCPLGGVLSLFSWFAPMRRFIRKNCNECSVCVDSCPVGVVEGQNSYINDHRECTVCGDCLEVCSSSSNGFHFTNPFGGGK